MHTKHAHNSTNSWRSERSLFVLLFLLLFIFLAGSLGVPDRRARRFPILLLLLFLLLLFLLSIIIIITARRNAIFLHRGGRFRSGSRLGRSGHPRHGFSLLPQNRRLRRPLHGLIPVQKLLRRLVIRLPVLIQLPLLNQSLLPLRHGSQPPPPRISIPLHNHPLDLGHHPVIARGHDRRSHLRDSHRYRLPLRRHEHHLLPDVDIVREPQQPRNHQLGPVTNGIDRRILHHHPLVIRQQYLQRHDHPPQILLVLGGIVNVLRVHDIVHRDQVVHFVQHPRPHPPQLLHVPSRPDQEPQVHAQSPDVRPRLARHPKNAQIPLLVVLDQLGFVNGPNPQLALDRRNEGRALKQRPRQRLHGPIEGFDVVESGVEADHPHVLLPGRLLRLDETSGAVDADDEAAGDFGVEGAGVSGLFDAEDALDPGDDLVGGGVGGFVEVDDAGGDVVGEGAGEGGGAGGDGGVVGGADVEGRVVFEEEGPVGGQEGGGVGGGGDQAVVIVVVVGGGGGGLAAVGGFALFAGGFS
mmetsp:Transcript_29648/g.60579  ORF Transcript_29648/g.60579 Transcript_29648/m.60579 type:complete len:523 (+) Transcript_29648:129-1697(+)